MELRPVQFALLAGRAASRWAALSSSTPSRPLTSLSLSLYASTLSRPFSSTRRTLQEAEATAPVASDMTGYMKQRAQQREERQRAQQQPPQQPQSQNTPSPGQESSQNNMLAPNSSPTIPATSPSDLRQPWASRRSNAQVVPLKTSLSMNGVNDILADLNLGKYNLQPTAEDIEKGREAMLYEKPIDVKYRLRPVIGRTVELTTGTDVDVGRRLDFAAGLARLEIQCKANRVKTEANRQRFHERKGLKKKRLSSERWKRRFKDGFRATCRRVNELAKQGW